MNGGVSFLAIIWCGIAPAVWAGELSKGHRLILQDGLNIFGFTFSELNGGFNQQLWQQSNLTGFMLGGAGNYHPQLYGAPNQFKWGVMGHNQATTIQNDKLPYFNTLKSWSYLDEQNISDPVVLQDTVNWMNAMRADDRVKDVILYANQFGSQFDEATVRNYMHAAKPDMLMFYYYIWGTGHPFLHHAGSPTGLYKSLAKYHKLALEGNDGTGNNPIPFGKWHQAFTMSRDNGPGSQAFGYRMSESELRLDQFAGWAFGATFSSLFVYDDPSTMDSLIKPLILTSSGPNAQPAPEFFYVAETNRQSRNIGKALVGLISTDVRMAAGPNTYRENGVPEFAGNSDPFLKSVSATNLGLSNGGARGDVLLGFFKPLQDEFATGDPNDLLYFMVVNGLTWKDTDADDTAQRIILNFDMGNSGLNSLQRISRETGEIEIVPLQHMGGSLYQLDLTLPGGTGDLFKYNTGSAFVPEPGALSALALVYLVSSRRRRA
jgi:hypothetical protein